jgi:hypothetical protein
LSATFDTVSAIFNDDDECLYAGGFSGVAEEEEEEAGGRLNIDLRLDLPLFFVSFFVENLFKFFCSFHI